MNEFKIFLLILGAEKPIWAQKNPSIAKRLVSLYSNSEEIAWANHASENVNSLAQYSVGG